MQPGDLIYLFCRYIKPAGNKYAVYVCPENNYFFFVNTSPRRSAPDAQVLLRTSDAPILLYDSHIDTSKMVHFSQAEIDAATKQWSLPFRVRRDIKDCVSNHGYLPPKHKRTVFDNL